VVVYGAGIWCKGSEARPELTAGATERSRFGTRGFPSSKIFREV
jgi:hypothetical protein